MSHEIRELSKEDREEIFEVINAAAEMYEGVIPEEHNTAPYMPREELDEEMDEMQFFGAIRDRIIGVIGVQERSDVSLIRHLYVRPSVQHEGIGTDLLETGIERADSETVLVGTWKAADWALDFYDENGFENLGTDVDLLSTYWEIPDNQRGASVVLQYEK